MKTIFGLLIILFAILFGLWLGFYVLLYGGIMQAIENWGTNNSAVVWGIIKAVFFECGMIPAYIIGFGGYLVIMK